MNKFEENCGIDFWQINVLFDSENKSCHLVTVTKDCHTGEFFQKLRFQRKASRIKDFQLFPIGGSVRCSLNDSWNERLSKYDIADRSTVVLVARVTGGGWPTLEEVEAEPRNLRPANGITLTTISPEHPDVLGVEFDGPGVIMRCGHATAPMALALFCRSELENRKDEIRCPQCNAKWKFALLKPAACLTPNEITEFENKAHMNYFGNHQSEMNPCPKCGTFSRPRRVEDKRVVCQNCTRSSAKTFTFCWTCLGEWRTFGDVNCGNPNCGSKRALLEILAKCVTKSLCGKDIPCKRACPSCSMIIDHINGCRHMICSHCKYEFCFICLKKLPCGPWPYKGCNVAPRQTFDTKCTDSSVSSETVRNSEESSVDETHFPPPRRPRIRVAARRVENRYAGPRARTIPGLPPRTPQTLGPGLRITEPSVPPTSLGMTSEETTRNTDRPDRDNSGVILEPSRRRGPPLPPKLQQRTCQRSTTAPLQEIYPESHPTVRNSEESSVDETHLPPPRRPRIRVAARRVENRYAGNGAIDQSESDVILKPSRKRGPPPPPPKPHKEDSQRSVRTLTNYFERILGTPFRNKVIATSSVQHRSSQENNADVHNPHNQYQTITRSPENFSNSATEPIHPL